MYQVPLQSWCPSGWPGWAVGLDGGRDLATTTRGVQFLRWIVRIRCRCFGHARMFTIAEIARSVFCGFHGLIQHARKDFIFIAKNADYVVKNWTQWMFRYFNICMIAEGAQNSDHFQFPKRWLRQMYCSSHSRFQTKLFFIVVEISRDTKKFKKYF